MCEIKRQFLFCYCVNLGVERPRPVLNIPFKPVLLSYQLKMVIGDMKSGQYGHLGLRELVCAVSNFHQFVIYELGDLLNKRVISITSQQVFMIKNFYSNELFQE